MRRAPLHHAQAHRIPPAIMKRAAAIRKPGSVWMAYRIAHGVAGPKVQSLTLTVKGVARDLALSPRRAFLAVLGPDVSITDVKVVATLKNGTREVLADPPPMG